MAADVSSVVFGTAPFRQSLNLNGLISGFSRITESLLCRGEDLFDPALFSSELYRLEVTTREGGALPVPGTYPSSLARYVDSDPVLASLWTILAREHNRVIREANANSAASGATVGTLSAGRDALAGVLRRTLVTDWVTQVTGKAYHVPQELPEPAAPAGAVVLREFCAVLSLVASLTRPEIFERRLKDHAAPEGPVVSGPEALSAVTDFNVGSLIFGAATSAAGGPQSMRVANSLRLGPADPVAALLASNRAAGMRPHNEYRVRLGLGRVTAFSDFSGVCAGLLPSVYASVDDVDLAVGLACESQTVTGSALGPTASRLITLQMDRLAAASPSIWKGGSQRMLVDAINSNTDIGEVDLPVVAGAGTFARVLWGAAEEAVAVPPDAGSVASISALDEQGRPLSERFVLYFHGISAVICWLVVAPWAVFLTRYLKTDVAWWAEGHRVAMSLVTGQSLTFILESAFRDLGASAKRADSVVNYHTVAGYIFGVTLLVQALLGFVLGIMRNRPGYAMRFIRPRSIHQILGLFLSGSAIVQVYTGARNLVVPGYFWGLMAVQTVILVGAVAVLEMRPALRRLLVKFRARRMGSSATKEGAISLPAEQMDDRLPLMSVEAFQTSVHGGMRWVILNNFVLDISNWIMAHPGGSSVFATLLGEDISSIFMGQDNAYKHFHSRAAERKAISLRIAKISRPLRSKAGVGVGGGGGGGGGGLAASHAWSVEDFERAVREGRKLVVFEDHILDVSSILDTHPQGRTLIKVGEDITQDFFASSDDFKGHSRPAYKSTVPLRVGKLNIDGARALSAKSTGHHSDSHLVDTVEAVVVEWGLLHTEMEEEALHPIMRVVVRPVVGPGLSGLTRFPVVRPGQSVNLFFPSDEVEGRWLFRPLTPTAYEMSTGKCEFMVRIFPEGLLSKYLSLMSHGSSPVVRLSLYRPIGVPIRFSTSDTRGLLLASGTGIATFFRYLEEQGLRGLGASSIPLTLISFNRVVPLIEDELREISRLLGDDLVVHHVITRPTAAMGWKGLTGRISGVLLRRLFDFSDLAGVRCYISGSHGFVESCVTELSRVGIKEDQIGTFPGTGSSSQT